MTFVITQSGRTIDFLNPDPDEIVIMDIAVSLSRVGRFGGHSPEKVAQHILEVLHLMLRKAREEDLTFSLKELSEIALIALIHDFPEYVLGDVPTPLKRLLAPLYGDIEARLLNVMLNKWSLNKAWNKWQDLLKWADQEAVEQEAARFRLDGWVLSEDLVLERRPTKWIPEDKPVNLIAALVDENDLQSLVTGLFIRHMVLSDRFDLLTPHWQKFVTDAAAEDGTTVYTWVSAPLVNGSLFTDHEGFL